MSRTTIEVILVSVIALTGHAWGQVSHVADYTGGTSYGGATLVMPSFEEDEEGSGKGGLFVLCRTDSKADLTVEDSAGNPYMLDIANEDQASSIWSYLWYASNIKPKTKNTIMISGKFGSLHCVVSEFAMVHVKIYRRVAVISPLFYMGAFFRGDISLSVLWSVLGKKDSREDAQ